MIGKKSIYGKTGFTLIELIICVIIISILLGFAASRFFPMIERSRGAEARAILSTIYTNFQKVADDGIPLDEDLSAADLDIDWNKIIIDDPNNNLNRRFDYSVDYNGAPPTAEARSRADGGRWLQINLTNGVITHSGEY